MTTSFDCIVIGGGPGGHTAAEEAARRGARVCIVERDAWGGTCANRGCIPTKALLTCSKRFADLKKLKRLGITVENPVVDFAAVKRHQEAMVRLAALGAEKSLKDLGVDLKVGEGTLTAPGEVAWTAPDGTTATLTAPHIVLAWGSETALPPGITPGNRILTSDGFLKLSALPDRALVIGASVIGVEFATLLAEFGTQVTLVEMAPAILPLEDDDAAGLLKQELIRLGVTVIEGATLESLAETESGACGKARRGDGTVADLDGAIALVCTGRRPRLETTQLDRLGIAYDRRGIGVNDRGETSVPGVYALGDCTGGIMLAHRAARQGKALASRLFGTGEVVYREEMVPSVIYSHPQIARVGLTERQARAQGIAVTVLRNDYGANMIARADLKGAGFVKLLLAGDHLVGAAVAGDEASELLASLSLAVSVGLDRQALAAWLLPHPTLSEVLSL